MGFLLSLFFSLSANAATANSHEHSHETTDRSPASMISVVSMADQRQTLYEKLRIEVNRGFDEVIYKPGDSMVVDEMGTPQFKIGFGKAKCGLDLNDRSLSTTDLRNCSLRFQKALVGGLAKKYFAADQKGIERKCKMKPTACEDPANLEYLVRQSHDETIENLRKSKLEPLEQWRQGQLSDEQLHDILVKPITSFR